jgi:hypothetical protein
MRRRISWRRLWLSRSVLRRRPSSQSPGPYLAGAEIVGLCDRKYPALRAQRIYGSAIEKASSYLGVVHSPLRFKANCLASARDSPPIETTFLGSGTFDPPCS